MGRDLSRVAEPDARGRAFHQRKGVLGGEAGQVDVESGRAGIDGDRLGPIRDLDEMLREAREGAAVALEIEAARSEKRRVGTECCRTGRSRGSQYHYKKK